jgi:hypothetical protein
MGKGQMKYSPGRQAALTRLSISLLSILMLLLAALSCQKPEATGGPVMESVQDTLTWIDTSEVEIRVVKIQGDSVRIVELRSFRDTNRVYTSKRYTTAELDSWHRDNVARLAQIELGLVEVLDSFIAMLEKER